MNDITFSSGAFEEFCDWQSDKAAWKKIRTFIKEIRRNGPLYGSGQPEKLKYRKGYSREITKKDRFVYDFVDGCIIIISCRGHYDDH